MQPLNVNDVIGSSQILVRKGRYAYLRANETEIKNHLMITRDDKETTVITEEKNIADTPHSQSVEWFTVLEVHVSQPFTTKGFLAKITQTIANQDMNVLVVATFSKNYILVREEQADLAITALSDIGFAVNREDA